MSTVPEPTLDTVAVYRLRSGRRVANLYCETVKIDGREAAYTLRGDSFGGVQYGSLDDCLAWARWSVHAAYPNARESLLT